MINIGISRIFTIGLGQVLAYIQDFNIIIEKSNNQVTTQFGIGRVTSVGKIHIRTPVGIATFYVMDADLPFLLYL